MGIGIRRIRESMWILGTSLVLAFGVNYFSPVGIALRGSWNVEEGVISARSKKDVVVHGIEIQRLSDAKALYDTGTVIFVDARHEDLFHSGSIKGALSLSIYDYDARIDSFYADHRLDEHIVTYCSGRECDESHQLASRLRAEGYTHVQVFVDGYPAWRDAGYPVEVK